MGSWEAQFEGVTSPCHGLPLTADRKDKVTFGVCPESGCRQVIVRANPRTGYHEYLDGEILLTEKPLRPVDPTRTSAS